MIDKELFQEFARRQETDSAQAIREDEHRVICEGLVTWLDGKCTEHYNYKNGPPSACPLCRIHMRRALRENRLPGEEVK